ncbi:MAG: hypothetical protein ACPGEG_01805 [Salibacteraceae bacterium]
MKNTLLILSVGLLLASCNWFKKDKTENETMYTIEGQMYLPDGITPMVGKTLIFDAKYKSGFSNRYEEIGTCVTDSIGYFSIEYRHLSNLSNATISIYQPVNDFPFAGPFLTHIPVNENIDRDICVVGREYVKYKFEVTNPDLLDDTLFVVGILYPQIFERIPAGWGNSAAKVAVSELYPSYESEVLTFTSESRYTPSETGMGYTFDRSKFDKGYAPSVTANTLPPDIDSLLTHVVIETETFPVVNTMVIKLE